MEQILSDARNYKESRVIKNHCVSKKMWESYESYLELLEDGFKDFLELDAQNPSYKGVYLKKLSERCLLEINQRKSNRGTILKNLWGWKGFKNSIGPYTAYQNSGDMNYLWRRYIQDESRERKLFRDMDMIKLTKEMIDKVIVTSKMKKHGLMMDETPLHNYYDLSSKPRFEVEFQDKEIERVELRQQ